MRSIVCSLLLLLASQRMSAESKESHPAESPVDSFAITEERAMDIFQALARQSHVVIGVSGKLVGSDQKLISIQAEHTMLKAVLDEICLKDPRYKWHVTEDGSIDVTVGKQRLELSDVSISPIKIGMTNSSELTILISNQPEVKAWKARTKCNIMQVLLGPTAENLRLDVNSNDEPLWKLLNDISILNRTYFWSAIKISTDPCMVSFNP